MQNNKKQSFVYLFSFNKIHYPHLVYSRSLLFLHSSGKSTPETLFGYFFRLALISTLKVLISNKIKAIFHIHMHIDMQNKVSTAHAVYGADLTTNFIKYLQVK